MPLPRRYAAGRRAAAYDAGTPQVLRQVLVGDCETPVAAFLKLL